MSRRRDEREPNVESLLRIAERADLLDDPEVEKLVSLATFTANTSLKRRIERILGARAIHRLAQPFDTDTLTTSKLDGQIILGVTTSGSTYSLHQNDLSQHLLTIGQSGAGKTTLFYNLMSQLNVPFWSFDLKQDYRHLIQDDQLDLLVLPWTKLRFNPLKPPEGVPPRRWAQVFAEIYGHGTALLSASKNHLMKKVVELYDIYGLFDEVAVPYPSLHELQILVEQDPINYVRKTSNYRDTVLNRLEAMTLTAGTVFDCSQGFPMEELLEQNVVFEFDGLGNDLQNFLMEILFAYVYEYRLATNQRGGEFRHVFFLDEGKRVFSVYKERQDEAGLPEIDDLTAKMREFGEGLVVADQEASKLTDSIKANTYTKVLLATGDAKQFESMTASMHLSDRQSELAAQLGMGEAIIQAGNHDPVPVKLDPYQVEKKVTEEKLKAEQCSRWEHLTFEPRTIPPAFEDVVASEETKPAKAMEESSGEITLSDTASHLLADVVENPFRPLSERYDRMASTYQGNKAKKELVEAGLVVERQVRVKAEKRKLLQLTERAREYLAEEGREVQREGRGGIVHRFWQHRIKELFEENGWAAKLELFDADVYVNLGNSELVVEVAMGSKEREVEHVKRHMEQGFDAVWVVCRNEAVRDGLRQSLSEQGLLTDRVTFRLFRDIPEEDISSIG